MRFAIGIALGVLFGAALALAETVDISPRLVPVCGGDLTGTYPNCVVSKINGSTPAAVATSGSASDIAGSPKRPLATVGGTLPACSAGIKGQMYMVTNALLPVALAAVAAGGAVSIGVTCDGTNWIVQ